jgi:myo-inositol 2-dehydrogenase/D-chiro-inositol 1-dehydrogenase
MRMRIGFIGAGRIGAGHARMLAAMPEVNEILITDALEDRARALAEELANGTAATLDEVYATDAVVIASSTDTHAELLQRAAQARVTTFCEKPIALDLESTKRAVAAIEDAGIIVQMGFQRRYDPGIRPIRDGVASGEFGIPFLVRSQTHDPGPPPLEYIPGSGGIFRDCLIHDIDAVRYVSGQAVEEVTAFGSGVGHPDIAALGDFGTAAAMLKMSGGTIGQISGMRLDPVGYDVRLEVFTPARALAAGWSERTPIIPTDPGTAAPADPILTFWDRFDPAYLSELQAFIRVIEGAEAPASTPQDAYENLRVAVACDISAAERRVVSLEEVS